MTEKQSTGKMEEMNWGWFSVEREQMSFEWAQHPPVAKNRCPHAAKESGRVEVPILAPSGLLVLPHWLLVPSGKKLTPLVFWNFP